jgi:Ran GTPase-activating protein (RanGAP) involved in mRNA processing and transport
MFTIKQTITTLKLDGNKINDEGVQYIANALQYNTVRLTVALSLSFLYLSLNTDSLHSGSYM